MYKTIQRLRSDESGVSPVIGVILMVAITVILAAVIAAFVLGFGADQETAPSASFTASQDVSGEAIGEGDNLSVVTFRHTGGAAIDADELDIVFDFSTHDDVEDSDWSATVVASSNQIRAGDTVRLYIENLEGTPDTWVNLAEEGDSIQLIWEGDDSSATIRNFEMQNDLQIHIDGP